MRALGKSHVQQHSLNRIGSVDMMLVESDGRGHLSSFETVELASPISLQKSYQAGDLIPVQIERLVEDRLVVSPLNEGAH